MWDGKMAYKIKISVINKAKPLTRTCEARGTATSFINISNKFIRENGKHRRYNSLELTL